MSLAFTACQFIHLVLVHGSAGSRLTLCLNDLAGAESPFPGQNPDRSGSFVGYTENPSRSFSGDRASGEAAVQQVLQLLTRWIPSTKTGKQLRSMEETEHLLCF